MTSLTRLLGLPYDHCAGRSFREMRCSCTFCLQHVQFQSTVQMKSGFVMAVLIVATQTKGSPRDEKCTMLMHLPETYRGRWFEKFADV